MVAFVQASWRFALSDGCMHSALHIGMVRMLLIAVTRALPTISLPALIELDRLQWQPCRSRYVAGLT
jgi:hypothetical protein